MTLCVLALLFMAHSAYGRAKPHYTFILPDSYVGWIQVVFSDPQASPLPIRKDGGRQIDVPESGIPRTSDIRVHDFKRKDEFYYRYLSGGKEGLCPVPSEYVMPGDSHGGFGVMDTAGKGPGYSWFLFIGPPELRAKVPLADWEKVVAAHEKSDERGTRIENPASYPTPGRISLAAPTQP
jgi:uncharacterized protein DUF6843